MKVKVQSLDNSILLHVPFMLNSKSANQRAVQHARTRPTYCTRVCLCVDSEKTWNYLNEPFTFSLFVKQKRNKTVELNTPNTPENITQ